MKQISVLKLDCCGCSACAQRCPKHCIKMKEDEEGFLYPDFDIATCIDCGLCEKVCPVINAQSPQQQILVYAAKNRNLQKRELSSSGGLFFALAEEIIRQCGVVFGVVFDSNWEAHHVAVSSIEELEPMMRSKYMQSRIEDTFSEAETYLKAGRKVMFTGTSCQIAALRLFLRKDYDNLLAVDVICHGVPSPMVWQRYLHETTAKASVAKSVEVTAVSFREKSRSGFDWKDFGVAVWGKENGKSCDSCAILSEAFLRNPFMLGFLNNLFLRPSCYSCPAKGGRSQADITIADYWGIESVCPEFYDKSGVGLAIIYSDKGKTWFDSCDFETMQTTLAQATKFNPSYWQPVKIPIQRRIFFKRLQTAKSIEAEIIRNITPPSYKRMYWRLKSKIQKYIKTILSNYKQR